MANPFDVVRQFENAVCVYTGAQFCVAVNSCTSALFLALKWHEIHELGRTEYEQLYGLPATVEIPRRTYVSVPMQIKAAGFNLGFRDEDWKGYYRLAPFEIFDSARWFTSDLFGGMRFDLDGKKGFVCVSFHSTKTLGIKRPVFGSDGGWCHTHNREIGRCATEGGILLPCERGAFDIEQGGAILHNDHEADAWFRRARFDGRTEGVAPMDDTFDMFGWHMYMNPSSARLGLKLLAKLPLHNDPLPNDPYPDLSLAPIFRR
jgi:hypothetical protein